MRSIGPYSIELLCHINKKGSQACVRKTQTADDSSWTRLKGEWLISMCVFCSSNRLLFCAWLAKHPLLRFIGSSWLKSNLFVLSGPLPGVSVPGRRPLFTNLHCAYTAVIWSARSLLWGSVTELQRCVLLYTENRLCPPEWKCAATYNQRSLWD